MNWIYLAAALAQQPYLDEPADPLDEMVRFSMYDRRVAYVDVEGRCFMVEENKPDRRMSGDWCWKLWRDIENMRRGSHE